MCPTFEIFNFSVSSYGALAIAASIVCASIFLKLLKRRGQMFEDGISFLMFVIVGEVIGSHLLYAITQIHLFPYLFKKAEFSIWLQRLQYIFGGSVFYGGLLGSIASGYIGLKILKQDIVIYSDLMAPIVPLLHGITRVGCFLAGCCYGIPSQWGFAAEGNPVVPQVNGIVRFPVQLLEAACNIILAMVLFILLHKNSYHEKLRGELFKIYLISYGIIRFANEFLRGDEIRGHLWIFSTSQWISIALIIVSSILLTISLKSKKAPST